MLAEQGTDYIYKNELIRNYIQALVGYHAGALVELKMTKNLSVREEFLFSSQGAKVQDGLFGPEEVIMVLGYYCEILQD